MSDACRIELRTLDGGPTPETTLRELVDLVDRIAEIPNSIRGTTPVTLGQVKLEGGQA